MSKKVKRLYEQIKPESYALKLSLDKTNMRFGGSVEIALKKHGRPSRRITLHQSALRISEAKIIKHDRKHGDSNVPVARINCHNKLQEARLHADTMLYPGQYTVKLKFSGRITKNMNGLYPCFFDHEGNRETILATQFESHHAREVFPCIDEPEAKATFSLELVTDPGETVLSNTPIIKQETARLGPKKTPTLVTTFGQTPVMPTYLLAFVAGKLEYKEAVTSKGTKIRVYATADNVQHTQFALDTAVKCLEFYNGYFKIPYPLEKCDLIALPDFASGAMENWGCITFREQVLLVDKRNTTLSGKQYVAMVIAHELAHQWFGNLVTMRWWTDLWLNEGFASWIEYLAVDKLFPEWRMWEQFVVDEQQQALKLDALENTHPVEVPVNHPDEIGTIFDTISYAKGASIIHMLHGYLGPEAFREGLNHYLLEHSYANTDTVDLWQALETSSQKPVKDFMGTWTKQDGFPLVSCRVSDDSIELSQQRFILNPAHGDVAARTWPIVLHDDEKETPEVFNAAHKVYKASSPLDTKLNIGQNDFYRVAYDPAHMKRLGNMVKKGQMPVLDRLGLLSDAFEASKSGNTPTVSALKLLGSYEQEEDYAVWGVISSSLQAIKLVMDNEKLREGMKPYVRRLVSGELDRLGWEKSPGESHFDSLLRPIMLGLAASADEPWVLQRCQEAFVSLYYAKTGKKLGKTGVDQDIESVIYTTISRRGEHLEFEKLLKLHDQSKHSEERLRLAGAITNFRQPELIDKALAKITTESVRLQDATYWIAYSFMNRHAKLKTWEWLKANWQWLVDNMGKDLSFYRMPIYAARVFSDEKFISEYSDFFTPRLNPGIQRSFKQGLEILQWQSAWKARDLKDIKAYFAGKN